LLPKNQTHFAYTLILFQHVKKSDSIAKYISKIDLSHVYDLCSHFYSQDPRGREADYRPQDALRSLLVMYLAGFTSINKWVRELKDTPRYAYLSGFEPDKTPSKAYFSWFTSMLFGDNNNLDDIYSQGILLKKIFELVFVSKSIELDIIDPHEKTIFDGCKVKSFCKQKYVIDKNCRCSSNKIKPFKCLMCSDSEATKGYDHNLDEFLLGYGLHFAVTPMNDNPSKCLPLTFFVTGADAHDSSMATPLLLYLYNDMKIDFNHVILDSGYDAWYIYWWISLLGGKPIIAINPRNSQTPTKENEYGLPICPAGHVYYYWGIDRKRRRYKWRCPIKASKKLAKKLKCNNECCCNSSYGKTVYTHIEDDIRWFTQIPRGSQLWKDIYARRARIESVIGDVVLNHGLKNPLFRGTKNFFVRTALVCMIQHTKAIAETLEILEYQKSAA
jgi:hypothetical protein